jgi:hypothetical protein
LDYGAISGMLIMGISVQHVFDLSPETNTGHLFLFGYLSSRTLYFISNIINMFSIPELHYSILYENCWNLFLIVIYLPIFAFPFNADNTMHRYSIWAIASMITIIWPCHLINVVIRMKNKLSISIPHLTERMGLLVVLGNLN